MKKLLFLFVVSLAYLIPAHAQTISGKVVDANTKLPIEASSVKLTDTKQRLINGVVTKQDGTFSFGQVSQDSLIVEASMIGYKTYLVKISNGTRQNVDLGILELEEDAKMLGEMVVTGNAMSNTISKTMIYPSQLQLQSSDGGLTLLRNMNLEGLRVDVANQTVSSSLASTIVYKINGVPSDLNQVIALQPTRIERIEYSSIASGRYASEDAAVINVILKEVHTGTYISNSFNAAPSTGFINENASVQTIFGKSQLAINYNLNWRSYDEVYGRINQEYRYPTDTLLRYETYKDPFHYTNHNINVNYIFTDKVNTFSAKFDMDIFKSRREYISSIFEDHSSTMDIERRKHQKDNYMMPSLDLYYRRNFNENRAIEFNVVGSLTNTDFTSRLSDEYVKQADKIDYVYQDTDGKKQSLIFEGLYDDKFGDISFTAGARGTYTHTKNVYIYDNVSKLKQLDIYPYVSVDSQIGNVSYSLSTGLKILDMDNYSESKKYYRNLSTLTLFYKKNSIWNVRYNFRYSPGYPSLGSLSNVKQVVDSIIIARGNPNIKPSQSIDNTLQFNLNYKKLTAYASVNGSKTFDFIDSDIIYDPAERSMVRQSDNYPYIANYGMVVQTTLNSILDIFSITGAVSWEEYRSKMNGQRYKFDQWVWYVEATANYKDFTLYGGYRSPSKSLYGQTISLNENYSNLSLSYKIKNLTLNAGLLWAFTSGSKYGAEDMSKIAPSSSVRIIRDNKSMITFGFRYNVNWGRSPFKINKSLQNSDNGDRGIL